MPKTKPLVPVNVTLFGNIIPSDIISCDEVTRVDSELI